MADYTAAEVLAAIDIVSEMPDTGRLRSVLRTARRRIEQRIEHDQALGEAFARAAVPEWRDLPLTEVGALIRAAVEATGATITEPIVDAEVAFEDGADRD